MKPNYLTTVFLAVCVLIGVEVARADNSSLPPGEPEKAILLRSIDSIRDSQITRDTKYFGCVGYGVPLSPVASFPQSSQYLKLLLIAAIVV